MSDAIDSILKARRQQEQPPDRFFSVIRAEGLSEDFLELRFSNGAQTCLPYSSLSWFNYNPNESIIDLAFDDILVTIKGRGLVPKLFDALKGKRVAWIREADSDLHDSPEFDTFIESIEVLPPDDLG